MELQFENDRRKSEGFGLIYWRGFFGKILMYMCWIIPIKQKKLVFTSYYGKYFNDSPKQIFMAMQEKHLELDYVWLMENDKESITGARVVKAGSVRSLYELATAGVWIDNCRKREWMVKKKSQFYVQTWHGGLALKKIEKDVESSLTKKYLKCALNDSRMADLFVSGCKWSTEKYKSAFWYNGEILEVGLPRSDIFYREKDSVENKVKSFYNLNKNDKLILYAPTFRADGNVKCYLMDYERIIREVSARFGSEWKVLVRLHPNVVEKQNMINYSQIILNGSQYQDIEELIVASDILITDYSSCAFDAMEAKKKVFLYATDIKSYMKDRGTYFDLFMLPFSIAQNEDELIYNIRKFNEDGYNAAVKKFIEKQGLFNNAYSADKVAEYVLEKIDVKK